MEVIVSTLSNIKYMQLTMLSKPACNRKLYKAIKKNQVASIVEIGLGDLARTENLIRVAKKFSEGQPVRYTGVDLFEAADVQLPTRLKDAHQRLKQHDVKLQLVPGTASSALARIANSHMRTDLIVFSGDYVDQSIDACWFYFPRMLHATSLFFIQAAGDAKADFEQRSRLEIERKIKDTHVNVARAA